MNKYREWLELSDRLKALKAKEMKMRKELCAEIFEGKFGAMKETFTSDNMKVVAENTVTYKLDIAGVSSVWEDLSTMQKTAVRWKPELILAQYKALVEPGILQECVTIQPAAPTLKVTILGGDDE